MLVRGGSALGSEHRALRVTYGLPEENERFLDALAEVLERPPTALLPLAADRVCYKPLRTTMTAGAHIRQQPPAPICLVVLATPGDLARRFGPGPS